MNGQKSEGMTVGFGYEVRKMAGQECREEEEEAVQLKEEEEGKQGTEQAG